MGEIFAKYLEAGIFGSIIILLIVGLRLCLRKAPRRILCLLWLVAAVRLFLPFQLESRISLQPDLKEMAVIVEHEVESPVDVIVPEQDAVVTDAIVPNGTATIPQDHGSQQTPVDAIQQPVDTWEVLSYIWLLGAGAAVVYMVISYLILKMRVRKAVRTEAGILECGNIQGAFLLGYLRPKIYLPMDVSDTDRGFIIAHERAHIARGDNWWKLLGFLCASLHWYNPLVWLSYVLLCRDIELACDERVIRGLDTEARKGYSMALLNCGKRQSGASVCPVAFGEVSLKTRIKSILRYRKPGVWITVIAFVLIAATAVCFLTSPVAEALPVEMPPEQQTEPQRTEETIEATQSTEVTEPNITPETTAHIHEYTIQTIAPTCIDVGYDLYICACGDQYTDNQVEVTNHQYYWAEADYAENKMLIKCATCTSAYWEKMPLSYDDTGSATQRLESYATAYGFQVTSEKIQSGAKCFSYSADGSEFDSVNSDGFVAAGKRLVDQVYDYCEDNNLRVSEQMCYIDVYFTGTGYGLPSTPLTTGVLSPSVQWDISSSYRPNPYSSGYYTGSTSNSGGSIRVLKYYIYIYIAPMPKETPMENQEDHLDAAIEDTVESTESTAPAVTDSLLEETVPETTEPTESPVEEEECLTGIPGLEETTPPTQENDMLPIE